MRQMGTVVLATALWAPAVIAQTDAPLNDQQRLGQRVVVQYCSLCHDRPGINSNVTIGPLLSKQSAGGADDVLREVIGNGTPRMPGYKLLLDSSQIDAVIAYLKTVPPKAPAADGPAPH